MQRFMHYMRKNAGMVTAVSGVVLMFAWVVLPPLQQAFDMYSGGPAGGAAGVALTWNGGKISERELDSMRVAHNVAVRFLGGIVGRTLDKGGQPQAPGLRQDQQGNVIDPGIPAADNDFLIVQNMLLAKKAREMGIQVDEAAVKDFLSQLSAFTLMEGDWLEIAQLALPDDGSMGVRQLFEQLETELLAQHMRTLAQTGLVAPSLGAFGMNIPPSEVWDFHNRLHRRFQIEALPLEVAAFKSQAGEPTPAEVEELFKKGKDRDPNPAFPEPGFHQPKRIGFGYFRIDFKPFLDAALQTIPLDDPRIEEEYKKGISQGKFKVQELPEENPAETKPAETKPSNEKPADTKPAAGQSEVKPADEKPADAKAETKPADEKPASDSKAEAKPEAKPADEKKSEEKSAADAKESKDETPAEKPADKGCDDAADEPKADKQASEAAPAEKPAEPKADAKPDTEQPAADKPAPEKPADDKKADDKKAADKPEAAKPADAKPAETPPAAPAEPKFKPLDEVRDEIRNALAQPIAEDARKAAVKAATEAVMDFGRKYRKWLVSKERKGAKNAPVDPGKLDLEAIARQHQLVAGTVPTVNAFELQEHEIGTKAFHFDFQAGFQGGGIQSLADLTFGDREPVLFQPFTMLAAEAESSYLIWATEIVPAAEVKLADVKDQVVNAWKLARAFDLAKAEAQKIAEKAAKAKSLKDVASDPAQVLVPPPFSWLTSGGVASGMGEVSLSPVEGVDLAGREFMEAVFALSPGQAGVAPNQSRAKVYVVRVTSQEPSDEQLRTQFLESGLNFEVIRIAQQDRMQTSAKWYEDLQKEMGVEWQRPPRDRQ